MAGAPKLDSAQRAAHMCAMSRLRERKDGTYFLVKADSLPRDTRQHSAIVDSRNSAENARFVGVEQGRSRL